MKQPRPQVDKEHYSFSSYYSSQRWCSLWHQLDEVYRLKPKSVIEIGPGRGLFKQLAGTFGIKVETVDVAADLNPDHIATASSLPFADASFDCVCAFQVLEHLPYEDALLAFQELLRVSKKNIVISLPDYRPQWHYSIHLPAFGDVQATINKPFWRPQPHPFNGEHYWVVNAAGYLLKRVVLDLTSFGSKLLRTYRVKAFPAHRFFIFEKCTASQE